jgi:hypothetical protein
MVQREQLITTIKRTFDLKTYREVASFIGISERHLRRFRKEPDKYDSLETKMINLLKSFEVRVIVIAKSYLGIKGYDIEVATKGKAYKVLDDFFKPTAKIEEILFYGIFDSIKVRDVRFIANRYKEIIDENYDIENDYDYFVSELIRKLNTSNSWKSRLLNELEIDIFYLR